MGALIFCDLYKFIFAIGFFFIFKGVWGVVIGFFIGSSIDTFLNAQRIAREKNGGKRLTAEEMFQYYQQNSGASRSNDVPTMLMALSAAVQGRQTL